MSGGEKGEAEGDAGQAGMLFLFLGRGRLMTLEPWRCMGDVRAVPAGAFQKRLGMISQSLAHLFP